MEKHVTILALIYISLAVFGFLAGGVLLVLIVGGGWIGGLLSGEVEPVLITSLVGPLVAILASLFSVPALIGGLGLLNRRYWARILTLVLGFLCIFKFPFGTVLCAYTLWVLLHPEMTVLFNGQPSASRPVSV